VIDHTGLLRIATITAATLAALRTLHCVDFGMR